MDQGASASQIAVARFLDATSRLRSITGKANDDIGLYQSADVRRFQTDTIAEERVLTSVDRTTPIGDRNQGIRFKNQRFP